MHRYIVILLAVLLMSIPAGAEPPIHTWSSNAPADTQPIEIHGNVFKLQPPKQKTRWQKIKTFSIKTGKVLINLIEVAGSIAQILQYAHR
jgi:hypothetical protein